MDNYRTFNLITIKKSLVDVLKNFKNINKELETKREPLTTEMVENIVEAYNYLNHLLESNINIFSPAGLYSLLELNHIILCGADKKKRLEYHNHILETRKKFQENIKPIYKWYKKNQNKKKPLKIIANMYCMILSQPQLFIEGNHRTGNIIVNYILLSFKMPPFIMNIKNAIEYLNISGKIKFSDKKNMNERLFDLKNFKKEFINVIKKNLDENYLN